jgi:hypothetical protein
MIELLLVDENKSRDSNKVESLKKVVHTLIYRVSSSKPQPLLNLVDDILKMTTTGSDDFWRRVNTKGPDYVDS